MNWENLIKRSGMAYILFKNRTGSLPPDHVIEAGYEKLTAILLKYSLHIRFYMIFC